VSYYTRLQLGDDERRAGEPATAPEDYRTAQERLPLEWLDQRVVPGVADNNLALADLGRGQHEEAQRSAAAAVAADPHNPAFLLTAAAAAQHAGRLDAAASLNAQALAVDPTAYPAANTWGVLLARSGQQEGPPSPCGRRWALDRTTRWVGSTWACSKAAEVPCTC
jgi:tetratricopeptide (TPR) repeat protein